MGLCYTQQLESSPTSAINDENTEIMSSCMFFYGFVTTDILVSQKWSVTQWVNIHFAILNSLKNISRSANNSCIA